MKIRIGRIALEFGLFERVDKDLVQQLVSLEERRVAAAEAHVAAQEAELRALDQVLVGLLNQMQPYLTDLLSKHTPPTPPADDQG